MDNQKEPKKEEKRNTGRVILLIIALVCLIAGLAYIGVDLYQQYTARQEDRRSQSMVTEAPSTTGESKKPTNPVNFKKAAKPKRRNLRLDPGRRYRGELSHCAKHGGR